MTNYQDNIIFSTRSANALVDRMFTVLVQEFPTAPDQLILSGRAAAILQGDPAIPLHNITFETDNDEIMKFIRENIATILRCEVFTYSNRTTFIANNMYFEVWQTTAISIVRNSGIILQNKSNIPTNLL